VKPINRRETNNDGGSLDDALAWMSATIARDIADGLKISSVTVNRHARTNMRGEFSENYFVKVESHDSV
jgi:hypothetical protein